MRRLLLVIAMMLVTTVALPARAFASYGWWDWLEQLSGPGPFSNGHVFDVHLACVIDTALISGAAGRTQGGATGKSLEWRHIFKDEPGRGDCLRNSNAVVSFVEVRGGWVTTPEQAMFSDVRGELVGQVRANLVQTYAMREVGAFAFGVGAGLMWFSGDKLDQTPTRLVVTPLTVAFMPLQLVAKNSAKARFIVVRGEGIVPVGRLRATDFNKTSSSKWEAHSELVKSLSVTFDVLALFNEK
jgi:hypothetical protein